MPIESPAPAPVSFYRLGNISNDPASPKVRGESPRAGKAPYCWESSMTMRRITRCLALGLLLRFHEAGAGATPRPGTARTAARQARARPDSRIAAAFQRRPAPRFRDWIRLVPAPGPSVGSEGSGHVLRGQDADIAQAQEHGTAADTAVEMLQANQSRHRTEAVPVARRPGRAGARPARETPPRSAASPFQADERRTGHADVSRGDASSWARVKRRRSILVLAGNNNHLQYRAGRGRA